MCRCPSRYNTHRARQQCCAGVTPELVQEFIAAICSPSIVAFDLRGYNPRVFRSIVQRHACEKLNPGGKTPSRRGRVGSPASSRPYGKHLPYVALSTHSRLGVHVRVCLWHCCSSRSPQGARRSSRKQGVLQAVAPTRAAQGIRFNVKTPLIQLY